VICGISIDLGLVHYKIVEKSCKSEDFIEFLKTLNDEIYMKSMGGLRKRSFIVDNCRIHCSKTTKNEASSQGIDIIFQPPYSPELNPVEILWSILKVRFKKRIQQNFYHDYDFNDLLRIVDEMMKEVDIETVRNVFIEQYR